MQYTVKQNCNNLAQKILLKLYKSLLNLKTFCFGIDQSVFHSSSV